MNKKKTITIGIPAYNEEKNIKFLLSDILKQKLKKYKLEKIIVYSDGSTDKTIEVAKSFNTSKITCLKNTKRKGVGHSQNRIFEKSNSDSVVILHADIRIPDTYFVEKLVSKIFEKNVDLTSARIQEDVPHTFIEKMLFISMECKKQIYYSLNRGNNIYTCVGVSRAFSKRLYKRLRFESSVGEDAFSYLFTKYYGYSYLFAKHATAYYKLPHTIADHAKQSVRFYQSQNTQYKQFPKDFIENSYRIPIKAVIKPVKTYALRYPLYLVFYMALAMILFAKSKTSRKVESVWTIANSSKTFAS